MTIGSGIPHSFRIGPTGGGAWDPGFHFILNRTNKGGGHWIRELGSGMLLHSQSNERGRGNGSGIRLHFK